MRVALLSMLDSAGEPGDGRKAFISFGGKTIAQRQIELVLALGCERVVCLADNLGPALIALQHQVEAAGAKFHVISVPRALCGLVYATDELIVLGDGLLPLAEEARAILSKGNSVVILPSETGISAGFERIDMNYAWAGALAMPGKLVERLNELPQDCDGVASLLRIALQSKVPERSLPETVLGEGRWAVLGSNQDAASLEPSWFRRYVPKSDLFAPGRWLAFGVAARFGVSWLNRGIRAGHVLLIAGLLLLVAIALGWLVSVPAAFLVLALAWVTADAAKAMDAGVKAGAASSPFYTRAMQVFAGVADLAIIFLLATAMDGLFGSIGELLFTPVALVGLIWLVPAVSQRRWGYILCDRVLLALVLALGALAGILPQLVQCLVLVLIACAIILSRPAGGLTQN